MKFSRLLVPVIVAGVMLADVAFAQFGGAQTVGPTVERVQPWAEFLQPYITMLLQTAAVGAIGLGAALLQKWFGVKIDEAKLARVKECAKTQVGVMVAAAEDNMKTATVDVGSARVKTAADTVIAVLPELVKQLNLTPESVQRIVAGEIGKMQAATPASIVQTGDKPTAVAVESPKPETGATK